MAPATAGVDTEGMTTQRRPRPVIRESRLGFTGAARHVWRITARARLLTVPLALVLIPAVWAVLAVFTAGLYLFGLGPAFLVYRFVRRAGVEVIAAAGEPSAPRS